jgi:hypothetical protein
MNLRRSAAVVGLLAPLATSTYAATITFDPILSRFYDPVGGNILDITDTFVESSFAYWGQTGLTPGVNSSGYEFDAEPVPLTEGENTPFSLGTFSHLNFPITIGTGISSILFDVEGFVSLTTEGGTEYDLGSKIFSFLISHDETSNSLPCPGPSDSVCDDYVSIAPTADTDEFIVEGVKYTLGILGFAASLEDAEDGIFSDVFQSPEGGENERIMVAQFTGESIPVVPAPSVLALFGAGLMGLYWRTRRRT